MAEEPGAVDLSFSGFVEANFGALLRTAVLLAGSVAAGEDLVQDTLTKLYPVWWRVEAADSPMAYVRASLTNTFLSSRRRASAAELVMATPPETVIVRDAADVATDRGFAMQLLAPLNQRQRAAGGTGRSRCLSLTRANAFFATGLLLASTLSATTAVVETDGGQGRIIDLEFSSTRVGYVAVPTASGGPRTVYWTSDAGSLRPYVAITSGNARRRCVNDDIVFDARELTRWFERR